jgi:hypothetical protein
VIEQNGVWAITEAGNELSLVARFEEYSFSWLEPFSPSGAADAILASMGKGSSSAEIDADWWCLSFGKSENGRGKYSISFHEYAAEKALGNHFIVVKAIIDIWLPIALASKDLPAFMFDMRMFRHFDAMEDLIDWAQNEDTEEERQFAASTNHSASVSALQNESGLALLDDPTFKNCVQIAKELARNSGKSELTAALLLCALSLVENSTLSLSKANVEAIQALAGKIGIKLTKPLNSGEDVKMPLDAQLRKLISIHQKSTMASFSLELLKTIS